MQASLSFAGVAAPARQASQALARPVVVLPKRAARQAAQRVNAQAVAAAAPTAPSSYGGAQGSTPSKAQAMDIVSAGSGERCDVPVGGESRGLAQSTTTTPHLWWPSLPFRRSSSPPRWLPGGVCECQGMPIAPAAWPPPPPATPCLPWASPRAPATPHPVSPLTPAAPTPCHSTLQQDRRPGRRRGRPAHRPGAAGPPRVLHRAPLRSVPRRLGHLRDGQRHGRGR